MQVWSPRLIEYIWYGCIPVVLGDDYYLPFSSLLDWSQFSIRICEAHAGKIKEILTAIPGDEVKRLRDNLKKVCNISKSHGCKQD
jgi:hypothetical protein